MAAVVSGAALIGKIPGGTPAASPSTSAPTSPTASPTGKPMPAPVAALANQIITRAGQRTVPAGQYLYTKWTDGDDVAETWQPSDRNGTWYFRDKARHVTTLAGNVLDAHTAAELTQGPDQFLQEFAHDHDTYTAFNTLLDLLVGPGYGAKLTGAQRATAYQALLKLDNVTFHDGPPGLVGVRGAAFTYRTGNDLETDILVDPETGDVIGEIGPRDLNGDPTLNGQPVNRTTITVSVVSSHP